MAKSDRLCETAKTMIEILALSSTTIVKEDDVFSPAVKEDNVFSPAAQVKIVLQVTQLLWEQKNLTLDLSLEDFRIRGYEKLLYLVWKNLI